MINLLIVDDEVISVKGIQCLVEWDKIGISSIYTAYDIFQAMEQFKKETIHIMLCDIEMPQGSGLDLLEWVREHYPKTECIFLTCHASFDYAKKAIKLGSLDYLLKPIPKDNLEKAISNAIDKILKNNNLEENSQFGKLWSKHQPLLVERFWSDIVNSTIPSKSDKIKELAEERNVYYKEEINVLPVFINVQNWNKQLSNEDEKLMEFALKKNAEEIFLKGNGIIFELKRGVLLALLFSENKEINTNALKEDCERYTLECQKYFKCDLSCYIGSITNAEKLVQVINLLENMSKNNVAFKNKVFILDSQSKISGYINIPDMNIWATFLKEGEKDRIILDVDKYLKDLVNTVQLDANILLEFQQDFIQIIHTVLKEKGIRAHQLFGDEYSMNLYIQATRYVSNLMEWVKYNVTRSVDYVKDVEESESVINRAKKYLLQNIAEDISRDDVANHVFLNPDYLTRRFKKETGMGITEYLVKERIKIAQGLLIKTNISVTDIATQSGYNNLAHFSRAFKKYTDLTPIDYRKKHNE